MQVVRRLCCIAVVLAGGCSKSKPQQEVAPQASGSANVAGSASAAGSAVAPIDAAGVADSPIDAAPETAAETPAPVGENLLSLVSGAFLVKQPPCDRAFDNNPINLIFDGQTWRSDEGKVTDQVFVIQLPSVTTLQSLAFDSHHMFHTPDENAKDLVVEASATSATDGFKPLLETTLPAEEKVTTLPVPSPVPARWIRLTVKSNHGSASAVALGGVMGYGTQEPAEMPTALTGTYRSVDAATGQVSTAPDADFFLRQDGSTLAGCWRTQEGTISGGLTGTVATVEWTNPDLGKNAALLVFDAGDRAVFWRLNNGGFWSLETYQRIAAKLDKCRDGSSLAEDAARKALASSLATKGRATVYGINFDFNSDKLRAESKVVLDQIVAILGEHPDWKLGIEGHTDSVGGAAFNQTLSEKRAKAVVAYLTAAKIAADRLDAKGLGLTAPIAENDTDIGRARNRRVELVKQ